MNNQIDHLLTPSLEQSQTNGQMYSLQAHFLVSFFGGPVAAVIFSMISIKRIGRLKFHVLLYVVTWILALSVVLTLIYLSLTEWPAFLKIGSSAASSARIVVKLCGVMILGIIYLGERRYFSVSQLDNVEYPSPWVPGVLCVVAGSAFTLVIGVCIGAMVGA